MAEKDKQMNRRDFIGQVGIGVAALGALPATRTFAASNRIIGANDRIRIGIIGAGDRGQQDLKAALAQPNVECVAVADVYSDRRDQVKSFVPKVASYADARRLLDRNDIDAVINATPVFLHAKYFLATLAAGKDLYSEKTMTWDIPEAVTCRAAAMKSKQVVQIGLQHESSGELMDAKKWMRDGSVGKVTMVESWMSRNTPIGKGQWVRPVPADCTPGNVDWALFLANRPKIPFDGYKFINWRLFWEFSGGNLTENMVHQIAWIISAMDLKLPKAATMMGGVFSEKDGRQVPDTIGVTLEYSNDLLVLWQSTFSNERYGLGEHILGDKGTIEHVSGATSMLSHSAQETINYYPEKINNPQAHAVQGKSSGVDHMANWMACIRDRKQPNANVEIGYLSAIAVHMSNLAYLQKRRVTIDEAMAAKPEAWMGPST